MSGYYPPARRDELAALSGIYRLLARLWMREVDLPLLRGLFEPPLHDLFLQVGGVLPEPPSDRAVEQLGIEFCQLFIGPRGHLPPFQSVWQTGQFQSQAATSMKGFVDAIGYDLDSVAGGIMVDHLGIQLDVMGHLANQCALAASEDLNENPLLEVSQSFFVRHLTWPRPLFEAAKQRTQSDFYRSLIRLTHDFLRLEPRQNATLAVRHQLSSQLVQGD